MQREADKLNGREEGWFRRSLTVVPTPFLPLSNRVKKCLQKVSKTFLINQQRGRDNSLYSRGLLRDNITNGLWKLAEVLHGVPPHQRNSSSTSLNHRLTCEFCYELRNWMYGKYTNSLHDRTLSELRKMQRSFGFNTQQWCLKETDQRLHEKTFHSRPDDKLAALVQHVDETSLNTGARINEWPWFFSCRLFCNTLYVS